jgi:hypothetical protein
MPRPSHIPGYGESLHKPIIEALQVRPANVKNACYFNKLMQQPPIRCDDRGDARPLAPDSNAREPLTRC